MHDRNEETVCVCVHELKMIILITDILTYAEGRKVKNLYTPSWIFNQSCRFWNLRLIPFSEFEEIWYFPYSRMNLFVSV